MKTVIEALKNIWTGLFFMFIIATIVMTAAGEFGRYPQFGLVGVIILAIAAMVGAGLRNR